MASLAQIPDGNRVSQALALTSPTGACIRVFQRIAHWDHSCDRPERNWVAANFKVAAALLERGDDVRCVVGDCGHSPNHGCVWILRCRGS